MSKVCRCPRCGEMSFELMESYAHCPLCLLNEDSWESPDSSYFKAMQDIAELDLPELHEEENELEELFYQNLKDKNETKNCA